MFLEPGRVCFFAHFIRGYCQGSEDNITFGGREVDLVNPKKNE